MWWFLKGRTHEIPHWVSHEAGYCPVIGETPSITSIAEPDHMIDWSSLKWL